MDHLPPHSSSRFLLHCSYLSSTNITPHFEAEKGAAWSAATWWLSPPWHAAEGFGFLSSFSLAPRLLFWVPCACEQGYACAARASQSCRDPVFFPAPLLFCVHVFLCNQKLLKPDVLIYNPYTGKQLALPSRCSESTFTSSSLPKEELGIKSQTSDRGLPFLPA